VKRILIITSEFLGNANKIGSHNLAESFAQMGIQTFVISFPISPLYRFIDKKTQFSIRKKFSKGFVEVSTNLHSYIPSTLIPPIPSVLKILPQYLYKWDVIPPSFRKNLPYEHFDLVFTESFFYMSLLDHITYKKLVLRIPDNMKGFWGENKALIEAENLLIRKADCVVSPSLLKCNELLKYNQNSKYLANGVNYKDFQLQTTSPYLNSQYKFEAVYVGAIAKWFDFDLLREVAIKKTNWRFTIIGNLSKTVDMPDNVRFIGEKSGQDKISFLQHADAGLIPFDVSNYSELINYVNPIKLYEYLAAGINVVSAKWPELEMINAPISLAATAQEFICALTELESASKDTKELKRFAQQFDWGKIAQQFALEEL